MIKYFEQFLKESADHTSIQTKMLDFLDSVNQYVLENTDNKFGIYTKDYMGSVTDATIGTKGSIGFYRKRDKKDWTLQRIIETGQFSIYISTIDSNMTTGFAINYIKEGLVFSAKDYSKEHSISPDVNSESKPALIKLFNSKDEGENQYFAMKALSRGKMPSRIAARPAAQQWLDLIKDFPKLDLTQNRGTIGTRRFGI